MISNLIAYVRENLRNHTWEYAEDSLNLNTRWLPITQEMQNAIDKELVIFNPTNKRSGYNFFIVNY